VNVVYISLQVKDNLPCIINCVNVNVFMYFDMVMFLYIYIFVTVN